VVLRRNTAAGNLRFGIDINGPTPVTLTQNNIYGNDTTGANCGLANLTDAAIDASNNFWGAASGPGPNPADDICNFGAGTSTSFPSPPYRSRFPEGSRVSKSGGRGAVARRGKARLPSSSPFPCHAGAVPAFARPQPPARHAIEGRAGPDVPPP
jgi:hypothetical protein